MLLDAHSHLDLYAEDQIKSIIGEINHNRILTISVSMEPSSYERNLMLAEKSKFIIPAFGIHPWKASEFIDELDELKPLIDHSPMIGEIGMDYRFIDDVSKYPAQRYVFEYFLKMAGEKKKIVNLHTAGAENEVLAMLGCYEIKRAIIHWYSGPLDTIDRYLEKGYNFTIGPEILFSDHIRTICRKIPDHLLLTETDNPGGYKWLTRKQGTPLLIKDVIARIAEAKNTAPEEIESLVWRNFQSLIKNDKHLKIDSLY